MLKIHDEFLDWLIEDISNFTNNFDNKMYIFEEIDHDEITIFIESYDNTFRIEIRELLDNNNEPYNLLCQFKNKNFLGFESIYTNVFAILLDNEENKIKKEIEMIEKSLTEYHNDIEIIKLLSSRLPIDMAIMCTLSK